MSDATLIKFIARVKAHIAALELDLLLSNTGVRSAEAQHMYSSATPHEDLQKLHALLADYQKALREA